MPDRLPHDLAGTNAAEQPALPRLQGVQSLRKMVYEALRRAIVSGELEPGEWLRQDSIAAKLGVSRPPVTAALIKLEAEGLVSFKPRRGAVVRTVTMAQAQEIFAIRQVLEPLALRRSMKRMTDERLARLRELGRSLDAAQDVDSFATLSGSFYRELYDSETDTQLMQLIEEMRSRLSRHLVGWNALQGHRGGHTTLISCVERGDFAAAKKQLLAHLRSVQDGYEQLLASDARG